MDITSLAVGAAAGIIIGAILFTPTGRTVSRAGGRRLARSIESW